MTCPPGYTSTPWNGAGRRRPCSAHASSTLSCCRPLRGGDVLPVVDRSGCREPPRQDTGRPRACSETASRRSVASQPSTPHHSDVPRAEKGLSNPAATPDAPPPTPLASCRQTLTLSFASAACFNRK